MLESELLNYGALGIWTIFNISSILWYRKKEEKTQERLIKVIENNTIAMTKSYEISRYCRLKNGN